MRQESHRVQWQHWGQDDPQSKRDLITSSAAIRLTDAARAKDVTNLLRKTMKLSGVPCPRLKDRLILVGTLFHHPPIQFNDLLQVKPNNNKANNSDKDPFHVVRSLQSNENPLEVRDLMQEYLKQVQKEQISHSKSTIAPKLQWFFVPSDATSQILNCVELDGYCTSMEDEDDSDENDVSEDENDDCETSKQKGDSPTCNPSCCYPWRKKDTKETNSEMTAAQKRRERNKRRHRQLALNTTPKDSQFAAGHLWKQSSQDSHVWRKVHCTLTEGYLWFVHRVKQKGELPDHGRIRLARALLIEPTKQNMFLHRMPFAFEVVSENGISHVFRAPCKTVQLRWLACLRTRMDQCMDNEMMEHAELIVIDETVARFKRLSGLIGSDYIRNQPLNDETIAHVIRWGMEVMEYRESCRHISQRLPTKSKIVATNLPSPTSSSSLSDLEELDSETKGMIQSAWDVVQVLLAKVTSIVPRKSRSIDTQCQHIEFVLTGRRRPLGGESNGHSGNSGDITVDRNPPPMNLFDNLLLELQRQAGLKTEHTNGITNL